GHDSARFDANVSLHHHLVCLGCGHILDVMDVALDRVTMARGLESGFQVLGHRVEFHGYCAVCCRGIGKEQQNQAAFTQ
ncbi:MAG: Fur family transcriptional regulator, partial [Nitrospiraceae bacterium]